MKGILITVRTGSTRLPKKALLKINGKTTIEHLIDRVKRSVLADKIILCTTTLEEDDVLYRIAQNNNIEYFRGSVEDKLERWKGACEKFNIEFFVTADGDDLFCEPELIDNAFKQYNTENVDYIECNGIICGAFTNGITYKSLKKVCEIKDKSDTEMFWPYFTESGLFNIQQLKNVPYEYKRLDIRMTLDYEDDFKFFKKIIEYFGSKQFGLLDIISYINNNPNVAKINLHLHKQWSDNQKNKINKLIKT